MQNYSVLMTVWVNDKPEYFEQSLTSMLAQTWPTDDLVIVKDGPVTAELERVISRYQQQFSNIHPVQLEENVGLGAALNAGLKICKNELVARMDADDIAFPNRCELQVAEFAADPSLDIIGGFAYEFSDNSEVIISVKTVPENHDAIYRFGKRRNPFIHPTVMYKKSTIEALGGYSTLRRGQDIELFSRLLHAGYRGRNIPQPLIKFRSDESLYQRRKSWKASRNYIANIYKSWRMGYASFFDLVIATLLRVIVLIIPLSWTKLIYRKILRKSK